MKKVIRCLGCNKVVRFYGSYAVSLIERTPLMLTGEIKEQVVKGRICRPCAVTAGYTVVGLNKFKVSNQVKEEINEQF